MQPPVKTKTQRFEYREIPRDHIRQAPYNPREINAYQRKNLKADLDKFGCVEPLVWNERTGNLVSGHQRLSIMDEIEGSTNYVVAVAVVKLTEKQEKQLNVLMNNPQAQGQYTQEGLLSLMRDGITLEDMAMTRIDIEEAFGEVAGLDDLLAGLKAAKPDKEKPEAPKLNKNNVRKQAEHNPENDADYYVVVEFETADAKKIWLRQHGFSAETRHLSINEIEAVVA